MKNVAKAKVIEMKIETHIYLRKRPEHIKTTMCFDVIPLKDFPGKTPIGCDLLFLSIADFPKKGVFSIDLRGALMKNFSLGKPQHLHFFLPSLAPLSSPPM